MAEKTMCQTFSGTKGNIKAFHRTVEDEFFDIERFKGKDSTGKQQVISGIIV